MTTTVTILLAVAPPKMIEVMIEVLEVGDRGNSQGRTGSSGGNPGGNPGGGVHKSSRFQGGAGGKDPGVAKLIEVCLPQPRKHPDQPDH